MVNFFARYCSLYKVWDKHNIAKWKHQKQAGIVKFILVEGVIKWGILSTLIFLGVTLTGREFGQKEVVTTCLIWLVASIVYGSSLWYGTSLDYKEQLKQNMPRQ